MLFTHDTGVLLSSRESQRDIGALLQTSLAPRERWREAKEKEKEVLLSSSEIKYITVANYSAEQREYAQNS